MSKHQKTKRHKKIIEEGRKEEYENAGNVKTFVKEEKKNRIEIEKR